MSIRESGPTRSIQNVFVLLLLAVFAAMSTLLVTLGAQAYRGTVERADGDNQARILSAVVRSALWAEDGLGQVQVREYGGVKALEIISTYDGESYVKRLYCHGGSLWESFTSADYPFDLEDGESLCQAQRFDPRLEGRLLTVDLTDEGGTESTVKLCLRSVEVDQ